MRALIAAAFISVQPNNEHIENAPPIELSNTPPHFFFAVASIVKLKWIPILTVAQESTFFNAKSQQPTNAHDVIEKVDSENGKSTFQNIFNWMNVFVI